VITVGSMENWWSPSRSVDGTVDLRASSYSLVIVIADRTVVTIGITGTEEN
jgi:hypothetical protein